MNTTEVANQLVDYCRKGQWEEAQDKLYGDNAVSIEPQGAKSPPLITGKAAIKEKGAQWSSMVDTIHEMVMEGPIVAGQYFTCTMKIDMTMKGGHRSQNEQVCVYKVEEGKIVSEQFFYPV